MNDPYATLGVSSASSDEDIAKAYKSLAKKYHPDLHPGDRSAAERMSAVNKAYDEIKAMRQTGNRRNDEPRRPENPGYADQTANAWGADAGSAGFDPFGYYRWRQYNDNSRPRRNPGGVMFAVFLAFMLFRLLLGVLLGGYTYNTVYGSGSNGYSYQMPYGYYQSNP